MEDEASFSPKKVKKKKKKKGDYIFLFDMCFKKQIFVLYRNFDNLSRSLYPWKIFFSKFEEIELKVTDEFLFQNLKKLKNCVQKLKIHIRSNYYLVFLYFNTGM